MATPESVLAYQEAYVELVKAWEAVPEDWRIILIAPPVVEDQATKEEATNDRAD